MCACRSRSGALHRIDEAPAALERRLIPDRHSKLPWYVDRLICLDALSALRHLPDSSVDCIVTSPPYFGQRDYEIADQIGAEETPDQYIAALISVFSECFRVLADTGSLWVNIGDKYQQLELLGLPWQLALSLKAAGWILRSDIIWSKPNAMPSSIKNRFTTSHEYLFFFVKSKAYYFDADAVREPHVTFTEASKMRGGRRHFGVRGGTPENGKNKGNSNLHDARWDQAFHPLGRNRRTVWQVPLSKFRDTHFAVFPDGLVTPCILAGTPPTGLVLDPFVGSGTTAVVARQLGRHFVGIDCNPIYARMAARRLQMPLPRSFEDRAARTSTNTHETRRRSI